MHWQCRQRTIDLTRPAVMGVINVTPDSFSDGGRFLDLEAAVERAGSMVAEGVSIIDVGGESTRPRSVGVDAGTELERVLPVIERIAAAFDVAISIDTSKLEVMAAAVEAGACIVNDIRALRAPGAREWAAGTGVGVCLMHMQGEPLTMQENPDYHDVVGEVAAFLIEQRAACLAAGIDREAVAFDPGLGFGKRHEDNLALLKNLAHLAALGSPLLVGVSRKSTIGRVLGRPPADRLAGGLGLAAWAVGEGARIVRTHDVAATRDAILMVDAVMVGRGV
ncbi:MAG TPA: dihydropteroate synthase [Steroidobacteraceae bacterium]|jgi:dihydropteroate synthase|nr:dihydropteroate synthase [Steroidobacteraceae bacterium]